MTIIERILLELSAKEVVEDGMPDFTNEKHILALNEVLIDLDWPMEARGELLYTLMEKSAKNDDTMITYTDKNGDKQEIQRSTAYSYLSNKDYKSGKNKNMVAAVNAANFTDEEKAEAEKEGGSETGGSKKKNVEKGGGGAPKGMIKNPKYNGYDRNNTEPEFIKDPNAGNKKVSSSKTIKRLKKNRDDIFNNTVSGKGGGETSVQEEIAGISRELAHKFPDDNAQQHRDKVKAYITENYGNSHWGSRESTIDKLIKKSASGHATMRKVKNNKGTKFADEQPEGLPKNLTFTDGGTAAVRESIEDNLEEAKKKGDQEAIEHYERELKYFIKHATSETGVEGDGDTAMMYQDTDGRIRIIYISNKQTLKDPHSNATVKSTAKSIRESRQKGANESALISRLEGSVDEAIDANAVMAKEFRKSIDKNKKELNKAPLTDIASKLLTGRAEFIDGTSRKYLDNCKKNDQVKEYIKKNKLDDTNDAHVVQAALAVAGSGDADGLNDSNKQAPNKLLLKMTNATSSIRRKMQKLIDKGKTPQEAADIVSKQKNPKGKPLMGGNLTTQMALDIYNNKALKELEEKTQDRKAKMDDAHKKMYNSVVELDVAHYMDSEGLTEEEAIEKYNKQAGPNEQTYTLSFLKRMHWDRYLDGVDDDKKMIEIGDQSLSPKDFKECLEELTGPVPKGSTLKQHLLKNMRIVPGSMEMKFVDKKGKEIHLGNDTWRTAGDLSKVAGGLGKDMQECLGTK